MKVKLTDGNVIVALVNTPLSGPVAAGSYVWLEGKVENRNKFNPTAIRVFPPDMCETFDDSLWNEMIGCMVEHPEMMYDFSDTGIHYGVDEVAPDGSNADIIPFPDHDQADQQAADAKAAGEDQFDESFDKAFG